MQLKTIRKEDGEVEDEYWTETTTVLYATDADNHTACEEN